MQAVRIVMCLWPGLPRLWWRGEWSGLSLAVTFAALLNCALVASLVWPEWVGPTVLLVGWLALMIVWVVSAWLSYRRLPALYAVRRDESMEDLLLDAQREYLRGNWFGAESSLQQILRRDPHDVDAQLMLASLYRRTKQLSEAENVLRRLEQLEQSEKWHLEIQQEFAKLRQLEVMQQTEPLVEMPEAA